MTGPALPSALDPFIATLRERLAFAVTHDQGFMQITTLFASYLAAVLEDARDALADKHEPTAGDAGHVFYGVSLPSHERIRAKYLDNVNPPTALERLVFDTTVDAPVQGEALRALLEGRPAVPVVTP